MNPQRLLAGIPVVLMQGLVDFGSTYNMPKEILYLLSLGDEQMLPPPTTKSILTPRSHVRSRVADSLGVHQGHARLRTYFNIRICANEDTPILPQ